MRKNNRYKILILISNLGRGGAQQVFRDQLKFFSTDYDTMGCVFNWDDAFTEDHATNILSLNIPAGRSWPSKIFFFWKRVRALREIKKELSIDFSISHLEGADYVNLFSKRKEKVICWVHGTKTFDQNIEGILGVVRKKILIPLTYKMSDLIVTVSEGIRQELIKNFKISATKIRTIYNGFDLEEISAKAFQKAASSVEDLFNTNTILITHCRLSKQKNLFALIDIFSFIKKNEHVKLIILGDGELRDELVSYCQTLSLSAYTVWDTDLSFNFKYDIYFLGYERNPYPFLRQGSLYLMTSSWEGFPLSLCEAMACGIPVIASDCYTGPREIITPELTNTQPVAQPVTSEYGILMPLANSDMNIGIWVNTITSLLNDPELRNRLRIKGKERVQTFDKKEIGTEWLKILK